ncbi:permease prefix domain 1-containing protein [Microbacterium sp.]|uniref:permease prefix domain 1-containing protein n=1 Tax=Microbacterium sp. TaxID=51671 RepID=UPI00333ECBDC
MNTDIHRLLDEAFAGIEMTPDAQDLKEEIRANLSAQVDELVAGGASPADAARQAVAELGDVRALLDEAVGETGGRAPSGYTALALRHRVRPKPGFVVRATVWSLMIVVGVVLAVLGATHVITVPAGPLIAFLGVASTGLWLLVGDSLSQETTTNHPMPETRAAGYGVASFLALFGLGFAGLVGLQALPVWCVVFAALGVIASIILFAFLGATQTNRHKAWTRMVHHDTPPNRFEREPETAARFGIYTAVLWIVTFAIIAVLVFTVGWWWAPVAFVGGFAAMMLLLARMLFRPEKRD